MLQSVILYTITSPGPSPIYEDRNTRHRLGKWRIRNCIVNVHVCATSRPSNPEPLYIYRGGLILYGRRVNDIRSLLEGSKCYMRARFPAGDEPLLRTATDIFGDQALGLAAVHVELVHSGLSYAGKRFQPLPFFISNCYLWIYLFFVILCFVQYL
jgi:hypothetical protein